MFDPVSTYRLQFSKDFSFSDLQKLIPYFKQLGVKTIYASPITKAAPGSTHGYDQTDPAQVNPEIGTLQQLTALSAELKEAGLSLIQDIVPNHMAYHCGNAWLVDVLENGQASRYASFFDILWDAGGKLMAPFLGAAPEQAVENGELKLEQKDNKLWFSYGENFYPLSKSSAEKVKALHEDGKSALTRANADHALLVELLSQQHYQLLHWQESEKQMNYRRFFTVNSLICLNIQDETVFNEAHSLIKTLIDQGIIQGLRVDHIDGLYDPGAYLNRLRELAGEHMHIVVEKILQPGEALPHNWPVQGTTGYDFLAQVNNVFVNKKSEAAFSSFYAGLVKNKTSVDEQLKAKKSLIQYSHMAGELKNLTSLLFETGLASESQVERKSLEQAIGEFLIHCPVYRYYVSSFPLRETEALELKKVFNKIRVSSQDVFAAINILESIFLEQPLTNTEDANNRTLHFFRRCMQFSGPLMAKGVEDTLMYTYNRFIGGNDVGDSPAEFGLNAEAFHAKMCGRAEEWPLSLNGTSTHDTKRGEDVRARLNVLTDIDDEWFAHVSEWRRLNAKLKRNNAPDANDEYFIYQTLTGAYPLDEKEQDAFGGRLKEYLPKALREAKRHSTWAQPDEDYEKATVEFALALLDKEAAFRKSFLKFLDKVADHGVLNSLSQLILKFTCPGVPDTYQGTEFWDLSLVDPDNRRPVDYEQRQNCLQQLENNNGSEALAKLLWQQRHSGGIKLYLLKMLLQLRNQNADLFSKGDYCAVEVTGKYKEHVLAFARRYNKSWCIVALPLHTAALKDRNMPAFDWKDTSLVLPEVAPMEWTHHFTGVKGKSSAIPVSGIFGSLPFGILKLEQPQNPRGAGILMPMSALPCPFGVGDLGPGARNFAGFLSRSGQKYWQLLPLNPTDGRNGFSPYSSISSMAGNVLLISPELLADEGLLEMQSLKKEMLPVNDKAEYERAATIKYGLLEKAYQCFIKREHAHEHARFREFCKKESYWLDDFAAFKVLKRQHPGKPWYEWPSPQRERDPAALSSLEMEHGEALAFTKWQQFVFHNQWQALRSHCRKLGVSLFGDLPFYVSHDSAEVWACPDAFMLDEKGMMKGIAGVPPDYFSETGQLWNMPTYNWEFMKAGGYDWWMKRMRKNTELFDLLRIDHFRAFAEYWEVPAGERTAVNGRWLDGPGKAFFEAVREALGELSIVAEDLGYNMEKVYQLREEVNLPGMKVLQFAFGENMPSAVDAPHNYTIGCVAYTGTHDNNTSRGWFSTEATAADRKRLELYTGKKINEKNVAEALSVLAYASVASLAIVPLQDLLNLDGNARMNTPGSDKGNWRWRLKDGQLSADIEKKLRDCVKFYNRL